MNCPYCGQETCDPTCELNQAIAEECEHALLKALGGEPHSPDDRVYISFTVPLD